MSRVPTMLIVDDLRFARLMIRKFVTQAHPDWTIIEAGNGQEALEKTTAAVDVMTIDLNIRMDGLTLATVPQARYPTARYLADCQYSGERATQSRGRRSVLYGEADHRRRPARLYGLCRWSKAMRRLTELQRDATMECLNIGMGRAGQR